MNDARFMNCALDEARRSLETGGIPIGAVLVRGNTIIGTGHNQRVQRGDAIAHGEMDCIRNAGRQRTYRDTVLFTTLSPCMMCSQHSGFIVSEDYSRFTAKGTLDSS